MRQQTPEPAATRGDPLIRLIATDLDGTLLRSDGTISFRTHTVLCRVSDLGVTLVLVTARPPRVVRIVASRLDVSGVAICCNGALVYDLTSAAIVRHIPLASEVARHVVVALRASVPGVCFAVERELRFCCEPAWLALSHSAQHDIAAQGDAFALCAEPVTKLLARHADCPLERLLALTRATGGDAVTVTHSGGPYVEVSAAGVNKASTLAQLCGALDIAPAEVVAFGDMPNDLPMLLWAGHGVAVANAHPDVLQAASALTDSNDQDGVAVELERLFDGNLS